VVSQPHKYSRAKMSKKKNALDRRTHGITEIRQQAAQGRREMTGCDGEVSTTGPFKAKWPATPPTV
jgi:hypothetical protein